MNNSKNSPFNGSFYASNGSIKNLIENGSNDEFKKENLQPFNGDYYDSNGNIRNLIENGDAPKDHIKNEMEVFNGDFYSSNGEIHNIEEIIGGSPTPTVDKPIKFYTPYGELVTSWSYEDAANATKLPDAPELDRLTFQEWNYSLETLKSEKRPFIVGGTYTTSSGKTEFDIQLNSITGLEVSLKLNFLETGTTITVDWGDGEQEDFNMGSTWELTVTHTYTNFGDYMITVDANKQFSFYYYSWPLFGTTTNYFCTEARLGKMLKKLESWNLRNCEALEYCIIPNTIESIGTFAFPGDNVLRSLVIPKSVTTLNSTFVGSTYRLKVLSLPDTTTSVNDYAFSGVFSVKEFTIPPKILSISTAFNGIPCVEKLVVPEATTQIASKAFETLMVYTLDVYLRPKTPPAMPYTAFTNIKPLCRIHIPKGSKDAYLNGGAAWAALAEYYIDDIED